MKGKTVVVTGGTGSLGRKFVELALKKSPAKIFILSRGEAAQVEMQRQIIDTRKLCRYVIGDVRDKESLWRLFAGVDYVVHAAALKNIEKTEYSPLETIKTNIYGAHNIIEVAIERKVEKVLAVSSDKAVNPTTLYGATKLCADRLFLASESLRGKVGTKFSVIRFGNFSCSNGSVIPHFMRLKKFKRNIPITDNRMTRYFIPTEEAANRALEALAAMGGGEIFVPKMGRVNIRDLALNIYPEGKIEEVGRRLNEKLHEELIAEPDHLQTREWKNFYVVGGKLGRPTTSVIASSSEGDWINPKELIDDYSENFS